MEEKIESNMDNSEHINLDLNDGKKRKAEESNEEQVGIQALLELGALQDGPEEQKNKSQKDQIYKKIRRSSSSINETEYSEIVDDNNIRNQNDLEIENKSLKNIKRNSRSIDDSFSHSLISKSISNELNDELLANQFHSLTNNSDNLIFDPSDIQRLSSNELNATFSQDKQNLLQKDKFMINQSIDPNINENSNLHSNDKNNNDNINSQNNEHNSNIGILKNEDNNKKTENSVNTGNKDNNENNNNNSKGTDTELENRNHNHNVSHNISHNDINNSTINNINTDINNLNNNGNNNDSNNNNHKNNSNNINNINMNNNNINLNMNNINNNNNPSNEQNWTRYLAHIESSNINNVHFDSFPIMNPRSQQTTNEEENNRAKYMSSLHNFNDGSDDNRLNMDPSLKNIGASHDSALDPELASIGMSDADSIRIAQTLAFRERSPVHIVNNNQNNPQVDQSFNFNATNSLENHEADIASALQQNVTRIISIPQSQPSHSLRFKRKPSIEKSGAFSKEENDTLERFVQSYCEENNLDKRGFCNRVWATERKTDNFWDTISGVLPNRTRASVYKHVRRTYHTYNQRGKWTPEEDVELGRLVEEKGKQWKIIGKLIGRMPEDCRDRWRNYVKCGNSRAQNKWSSDEEALLMEIVSEIIANNGSASRFDEAPINSRSILSLPNRSSNESAFPEINWTIVSERMGGKRSRIQCRYKWNKLQKSIVSGMQSNNTNSNPNQLQMLNNSNNNNTSYADNNQLRILQTNNSNNGNNHLHMLDQDTQNQTQSPGHLSIMASQHDDSKPSLASLSSADNSDIQKLSNFHPDNTNKSWLHNLEY